MNVENFSQLTFEVTHQAVSHALVKILNALGQLIGAQVLSKQNSGKIIQMAQNIYYFDNKV